MSKYPDSFRVNCVGTLPCNNNRKFCDVSKEPVVIQNGNVVSEENSVQPVKSASSTTTHCLPYKAPQRVIQHNEVDFKPKWSHTWSNTRGYGNIVVGTNDTCNNIHGKVHPWNRIQPLSMPYDGPAVMKDAWKMNEAEHLKKM